MKNTIYDVPSNINKLSVNLFCNQKNRRSILYIANALKTDLSLKIKIQKQLLCKFKSDACILI